MNQSDYEPLNLENESILWEYFDFKLRLPFVRVQALSTRQQIHRKKV